MGMYELIKGDENGMAHQNKNSLKMEEGYTEKEMELGGQVSPTKAGGGDARGSTVVLIAGGGGKGDTATRRLVSLDVFRGITVALMILVDDAGGIFPAINHSPWDGVTLADFVMPFFLFIVGVALALAYKRLSDRALALRKAVLRALKLFLLGLFLQGGYFHGINNLTYGIDITHIRLMGTLQRIAIAYLVTAACEILLKNEIDVDYGISLLKKYQYQWYILFECLIILRKENILLYTFSNSVEHNFYKNSGDIWFSLCGVLDEVSRMLVVSVLSTVYIILLYGLYVPDWEYQVPSGSMSVALKSFSVKCGVRGDTSPACNAVGMIDRKLLGIEHLYKRPTYARTKHCSINSPDNGPLPPDAPSWCQAPFDPEGLLSSVMAIVTCLIGLHYGHIIVHFKAHKDRILHWMIPSVSLVVVGFYLDFMGMHLNKVLYSFSYTFVTAGAAGILFVGIYVLVDVYGYRRPTLVMEWMGTNALMIYILVACNVLPVMLQGFYWKKPENNFLRLIGIGS